MKTIAAAQANRQFSALLREVAQGTVVTVVSRGRPVAKMVPPGQSAAGEGGGRSALLARLKAQAARVRPGGKRNWKRSDLYD